MTEAIIAGRYELESKGRAALRASARFWFVVAALGQWLFVAYIAIYFGRMLLRNGIEGLRQAKLMNGFIAGDAVGNVGLAAHLMLAMIIMGVGPLQLIPQIRARFPALHRGLGRTYMLAAVTSSIAGLYLTWARPLVNPLSGDIGTSLGGVLVIIFAPIALRHAIARDIPRHRRWALRLFIVASDVWFVRVDAFLRSLLPGGGEITGPMSDVWNIAKHLLPLAVLELYFRARDGSNARVRWGMVAGLFALTMLMGAGIAAVATRLWLPRM